MLDLLADDEDWAGFQAALNRRTLQVYELSVERVCIDSTSASGYWSVNAEGLFQFGRSKDQRPDLPQLKVVLATLDPLGMPVVTQVVAGNQADDPLYISAIEQVRAGVGRHGLLYVGDSKMTSLETRAYLQTGRDYYLGPLSAMQVNQEEMRAYLPPIWEGKQAPCSVERQDEDDQAEKIAEGYKTQVTLRAVVNAQEVEWTERGWVVRSLSSAQAAGTALRERLKRAEQAILALNERKQGKKRLQDEAAYRQAAEAILKSHQVAGVLTVQIQAQTQVRQVRAYRNRPAEARLEQTWQVSVEQNQSTIEETIRALGWRVYASNAPGTALSLQQAALVYREEFLVERNFGRLKGSPLSPTPMYIKDDRRASGLVRLLSIGLRVLTLFEHVVHEWLAQTGKKLSGLYAGNPKRSTARPTTEMMLRTFKDIFLNFVALSGQSYCHITPLSTLQKKILQLLDVPESIYTSLPTNHENSP